jgi:hypothetical protein
VSSINHVLNDETIFVRLSSNPTDVSGTGTSYHSRALEFISEF